MTNTICDRDYEVVPPTIKHIADRRKAGNRVHVSGINKADGSPIRFKSQERAMRHIQNMRLER